MPKKNSDTETDKPGKKTHQAKDSTYPLPLTKAAAGNPASPQKVESGGGGAPTAVVTQAELAELSELDRRVIELMREADVFRKSLADRLFGPTKIEPGPLGVILEPTPSTAAGRTCWRAEIEARTYLSGFLDHKKLNPRGIRVIRYEPSKGKEGMAGGGMFGDPRKVDNTYGGYM